ncbi:sodium- and chloride-dependent glycine transporter 1 [Lepeophtheirus salmonis]|uniref:Transporter n=1 Tax=Lepeophtheirus salmonis TaxID=72036 RepID=A0A0K2TB29_LEPSM|nr:sodium- and chloride-dependent glycine transporter 1-like [Lepeophtheirus salmonis]
MRNYNVSSQDGVYGSYLNYGYNYPTYHYPRNSYHSEMSEYDPKNQTYPSAASHPPHHHPPKEVSNGKNGHKRDSSVHHPPAPVDPIEEEEEEYDRGHWGSKAEFLLSCIGYSVGLGNVWRFPYLAYKNGGAAFLIPYFILLMLVGKPLYYLETAMGQFSRSSCVKMWNCAPIAKGVGFGMLLLSLIIGIYYNVIMAYSLVYIGASFQGLIDGNNSVPWANCNFPGATENCTVTALSNETFGRKRCRLGAIGLNLSECTYAERPSVQYWERYVLNLTEGGLGEPGDIGGFDYHLPVALFASWVIVFLCLMKGVKSSGKVVYFTATFPYLILIALLIRGVLLEGAVDGLKYLFIPRFEELAKITVWKEAAEQMFFSLGISWGGLLMFGSYNKFYNKVNIDAAIVSTLDFLTSIISSVVVFSVLGNLKFRLKMDDIKDVAEKGNGLAFVVYPEALSQIGYSWLWAILFFFMLFLLGLDSEFAFLETILTAIYDGYPKLRKHKVLVTLIACVSCFLMGLPCTSRSGPYIFELLNSSVGYAVLWVSLWEIIGFMWIYGHKNVCRDFKLMLKSSPGIYWKITWVVISPLVLIFIIVASIFEIESLKYDGDIPYPPWAQWVYWALVIIPAVQIPLWALITSIYYLFKRKLHRVIKPTPQWGPGDKDVRRAIIDQQNGIVRARARYAYDNQMMGGSPSSYPYT